MNKKVLGISLLSIFLLTSCGIATKTETIPNLTWGWSTLPESTKLSEVNTSNQVEKIEVTILTDTSYFKDEKSLDSLITRIKWETFLKDATIKTLDFNIESDKSQILETMTSNKLSLLPIVLLNTNELNDEGVMSESLSKLESGLYSLNLQPFYNPITKEEVNPNVKVGEISETITIDKTGLLFGKENARYSLMMFNDFDCPYCKQSNESSKYEELVELMKTTDGNIIFKHFPLTDLHPKSNIKSLLAISETLKNKKLDKALLTKYFNIWDDVSLDWQDVSKEQEILDENTTLGKTFQVQGTPTIVVYDNKTRKYLMIPELMTIEEIKIEFEKFITQTNIELQPSVKAENATILPVNEDDINIEEIINNLQSE